MPLPATTLTMFAQPRPLILIVQGHRSAGHAAEVLHQLACDLVTVRGEDEARMLLASGRTPAVVVLDGDPDEVDRYTIQSSLKETAPTQLVPLISLVTGPSANSSWDVDGGVHDVLVRPVAPETLVARVRSLLALKSYCDEAAADIQRLTAIGIGLSVEHNLDRLLERILEEAREINDADAGTLYTLDPAARVLRFQITQNDTLGIRMGGTSGRPIPFAPVPLTPANVSAYVALTGETLNITDVYEAEGFDFSGTRKYDQQFGYRCRSMLVVPMKNHEDEVVAVLQLINAQKPGTRRVVPFLDPNVERTQALASQAGIAINNARLINDLQALLEGLIRVMAVATDEKSPYTAGHIQRVTRLGVLLAEAVNTCSDDRFEGRRFSQQELDELRIAGLLHDIGKIVIPEHVVDKATRLHCLYDRIAEVRARFSAIRRGMEIEALRRQLELVRGGAPAAELAAVQAELEAARVGLSEDLALIESCNPGGEFTPPEKIERIQSIAAKTYLDDDGTRRPYLTENEARNLCISRGTLLPEELKIIRSHASVSIRLLESIPFPHRLQNVPRYAGDHHECLNGTGYPAGKTGDALPLQSRILAIADIFDALTAADRPYKRAFPVETAYRILREEVGRGKLDAGLVELFITSGCCDRLQAEGSAAAA